jgi:integrase
VVTGWSPVLLVTTMATAKLTKRTIDAAKPTPARYEIWDADLKGFGVRIEPTGIKTFIIRYRAGEGGRSAPKRFLTVGRFGTLTPDEARRKARELLGAAARGDDPAGERTRARAASSVAELAKAFMAQHVETKRKLTTAASYRHVIGAYILPEIGKRKAGDITKADLARIHHKITDKPAIANRVLAVTSSMFAWGGGHGYVPKDYNPVSKLERYREERRERFLSITELQELGAALSEAETTGLPWQPDSTKPTAKHAPKEWNRRVVINPYAAAAIRLLLLTGARLREILHLRWEHVDLERGLLLLPESKTGRKTIVLNAPALAILDGLERQGPYVIVGEGPDRPRADLKRPWEMVANRAGLEGVRLHDLRHTHASFGAGAGLGLPIIGKLLGHTQAATTQRYAHLDADPLRRASDKIGGTIAAALAGKLSAEVVTLPKRRDVGT